MIVMGPFLLEHAAQTAYPKSVPAAILKQQPASSSLSPSPTEVYFYQPVSPRDNAVRVGWMYPASYAIAMSSLGYLSLFKQLDTLPDVHVQRVNMDSLKAHSGNDFELMGFSFSFELDVMNILKTLEAYQLPVYAAERTAQMPAEMPLIFAGGPVPMTNPEPFADFFDFFVIGEGEEILSELISAYQTHRHSTDRQTLLRKLAATVPGLYVPSLYQVDYEPEGPITAIKPAFNEAPFPIRRRTTDMTTDNFVVSSPILTDEAIFSRMFLVEVMRGCAHRCRFCLASYSMLPARGPGLQPVMQAIETGLAHTHKIGLLGALVSNHPQFDELCTFLQHHMDKRPDMAVSSASLRADTLTRQIAQTFKQGKQNQLTIAVESGSEKLRRRINKNLRHEDILQAAEHMAAVGMRGLKLYGMVGLPDETEDDVLALAELLKTLKRHSPQLKLYLGCSSFVPKAATPFQWQAKLPNKAIETRFALLRKALLKTAEFRPSSARWDFFQAVLSRGDRRLSSVLVRFCQLGGSLGSLQRAYKDVQAERRQAGLAALPSLDWYACRERHEDEILPWDMLHLGVDKAILYQEGQPPAVK